MHELATIIMPSLSSDIYCLSSQALGKKLLDSPGPGAYTNFFFLLHYKYIPFYIFIRICACFTFLLDLSLFGSRSSAQVSTYSYYTWSEFSNRALSVSSFNPVEL